jgi:hypothetical protein
MMVERRTWEEFRKNQLLWWINRTLHLLGWAIVYQIEEDGSVSDVYPARVKFRGFNEEHEAEGFKILSQYIEKEASELAKEAR